MAKNIWEITGPIQFLSFISENPETHVDLRITWGVSGRQNLSLLFFLFHQHQRSTKSINHPV